METLEEAILRLAPKIDFIHEFLGIGIFVEAAVTTDGFFLWRAKGDCGFNYFLGMPPASARARAEDLFFRLSDEHQDELIRRLYARGIPPQALGIPDFSD